MAHHELRVHDQVEIWRGRGSEDGDMVFKHTMTILQLGRQVFYHLSDRRLGSVDVDSINLASLHEIPSSLLWPRASAISYTPAPALPPQDCYIKRPNLTACFENDPIMRNPASLTMNEIATCETLKMNPHPNISRYHGCVVEDGWIKGLSFDRYAMTLAERVQDERPLDIDACLRGIQAGVDHLHSLGLIHNDLHPDNIMMNGDDTVVIIDFDSSRPKGMGLEGAKGGTVDWTDVHAVRAERENDMYSMHLIWVFLVTGL